jgi:hypothetical protein
VVTEAHAEHRRPRYDTDHVHFIDGGDGGYAEAAKQLKAKRAAAR